MLREADLDLFLTYFEEAAEPLGSASQTVPTFSHDAEGLMQGEVRRLSISLRIHHLAGLGPDESARAAELIAKIMPANGHFSSLDVKTEWIAAIGWAKLQLRASGSAGLKPSAYVRHVQVGKACARLIDRGYKVTVNAFGAEVDQRTREAITASVESLIRLLGGIETAQQICRFMNDAKLVHDGMWMFGDRVPGVTQSAEPAIPTGWLFSLAIKHFDKPAKARRPAVLWRTLLDLAADFAAALDCQRYGQFEELDIAPTEIHRTVRDTLVWREVFTLPQVPQAALPHIRWAMRETLTPADHLALRTDFSSLFDEVERLVQKTAPDRLTRFSTAYLKAQMPILWRYASAAAGSSNKKFSDPLLLEDRDHVNKVLFQLGEDHSIALPRPMVVSAALEVTFRLIWTALKPARAAKIVGLVLEKAIKHACNGKAPFVAAGHSYQADGKSLELDVGTQDGERFVLVETKAKSLTAKARSGDQIAFFTDYASSFLAMMEQLVRHDIHLSSGKTSLSSDPVMLPNMRTIKVAVSPLTYGPVSDKLFNSSFFRSVSGVNLVALTDDPKSQEAIAKFNVAVTNTLAKLARIAPKVNGELDLFVYLIDVFWLDLGQFLYALNRGLTSWDALAPLKHMTFSTRDFWTEVAYADRQGLTTGRWHPVRAS